MTQPARPLGFLDFCRVLGGEQPEPGQRAMCGVCFDGQEPEEYELGERIFGYRNGTPAAARDVIGLVAGGRGGKTKWSSRRMLHLGLTVDISALAPGEHGYVFLVAPKIDLASQALSYIKGDIARKPRLAAMCEVLADEVVIDRGGGKHVTIQTVAAGRGGAGLRGRSLLGALLDETAFFRDETTGVVNDRALYKAIAPRVIAGGQVIVQSTPWARTGLLYDLYRECYGRPGEALVAHAPTRLLRTDKKILSYVEREYARDPENARVEFGAEFGSATATQWLDPEALERAVLPAWEPNQPRPGDEIAAGGDLGFARNSSSLVVARRPPGGVVELLLVEERRPEPGKPLRPSEVCRAFAMQLRALGLRTLYADRHYAETAREHLDEAGLVLGDPPPPDEAWGLMRQLVRDGQIRLPRHPLLLAQLAGVQGKLQSGGAVSITLPKTPDGRHGDLAAACALAVWALHNRPLAVAAAAPSPGTPAWDADRLRRQEAAIEQRSVAAANRPWWETEGGSLDWAA